jgi:hypothetical protein
MEMCNKCPNFEKNNADCPCPNSDCKNHGTCCDCIRVHRSTGSPVACMRSEALNKS